MWLLKSRIRADDFANSNKISNWPQLCNEIDAVIQSDDGRRGCLEIKLGMNQVDKAAANLLKMNDFFKNNSSSSPAFLAVICGMTSAAYRRPDGVYVIPITSLRP